jgi:putative oxidoreductase
VEALRAPLRAVGHAALAAMFITGGADALLDPGPRAPRAAELGVPLEPKLAVRVNGATMLVAGAALAVGVWPRLAAAALAGTLVPTTLAGHPYWRIADRPRGASSAPTSSRTSACSAGRCWSWLSGRPVAADRGVWVLGPAWQADGREMREAISKAGP